VAHALDGERTARAFAVGTAGDLTMRWAYALRHRSIPTGSYETNFDDPRSGTWERTMSASIGYEHAFQDLSRAYVNASIDEYAYGGTFPYASVVFRDGNDGHALSLETQYLRVLASGHTVTVGSRIRYVGRARMDAYDVSPPNTYVDLRKTARSGAVFAQAAWLLGSHATLYTGIRHDRYEDFGGGTNPRLALVLHPTLNTSVKALYGQAFRTPSLYERFYDDGSVTQKRAAHLRPEHVRTLELSLEHRLSAELALSLDAYDVRTHDLINLTSDPADQLLVYINEGRPRSTGFEGEFSARIGRVEGRAALAREYARDEKSTTLFDSPRTTGRVGVSVPVTPRGRLAFEMRHLSERATLAGSKLPAYTLLNLTFTARLLSPAIELLLAAQNALDLPYADPAGEEHRQTSIVQDGRSIRASVRLLLK
jgi:iron complex outermembrane receptor protein